MRKFAFTVAAATGALALTAGTTAAFASGTDKPGASTAATANAAGTGAPAVAWNEELQAVLKVPGLQPPTVHPTRSYALLHLGIYDAVASVTRRDTPYVFEVVAAPGARADAAAEQAAHDVLTGLYPTQQASFDTLLSSELASVPPTRGRAEGERVGHVTAAAARPERGGRLGGHATAIHSSGRGTGRLPAHAAQLPRTRLHQLGERDAVCPQPWRPVPARAATGPDRRCVGPGDQRGPGLGPGHERRAHRGPDQ